MGKGRRGRPARSTHVIDLTAAMPAMPEHAVALLPPGLQGRVRGRAASRSPLGYLLAAIPGGRRAVFHLLSLSDDPEAVHTTSVYNTLSVADQHGWSVEAIVDRCAMRPRDFIAMVSRVGFDFNIELGNSLAAFAYPRVMKASIDRALKPHGTEDRRIHLEHSGFAASKKGAFIQVNQNNQTNVEREPEPGEASPFERVARRVVRDIPHSD